ncbi:MAG: proline dehydrogenase family protein [Planctomycetota bacterium]|nr:proline dehydrogenase family protein [Planctomycetota bacterium]
MPLLHSAVMRVMPHVPKAILWRVAKRYVAGETLQSAIERLKLLNGRGHPGVIDVLGEDVNSEEQARHVVAEYKEAAEAVVKNGIQAYVSVKPTHLGLRSSERLALSNYAELAKYCKARKLFLRVEMEDASTTDATLRIFEELRKEHDNVGIVLQSRLFRTPDDISKLAPGPLNVRMVKGIYLEPAKIAHTEPEPIRQAYIACTQQLFERKAFVALATHDAAMGDRCAALANSLRVGRDGYEFQMLLGVMEPLWQRWQEQNHVVRVYVPFGPQWQPYSLRRMRKNPQIFWNVTRAMFGMK